MNRDWYIVLYPSIIYDVSCLLPLSAGRFQGRGGGPVVPYIQKMEKTPIDVMTNFYPIKFTKDVDEMELFQYHIKIVSVRKEFIKDEAGEILKDEKGWKRYNMVPKEDSDLFVGRNGETSEGTGSDLTRQILLQCQRHLLSEEKKAIVSFLSVLFCPIKLFLSSFCHTVYRRDQFGVFARTVVR